MYRSEWQRAVFAALVAALVSTSTAVSAAPGARPQTRTTATKTSPTHSAKNAGQKAGQNAGNTNNTAAITALHQAHALLVGANHDYQGHRAKAATHITHALHELGHQHQHGANKGAPGTAVNKGAAGAAVNKGAAVKGNANKEPQAQSDAQLRQAIQLLSGLQGHVPNTHKAASHVQSAITELNTALKIK